MITIWHDPIDDLPALELTTKFGIGHRVKHAVSGDAGVIADVSEFPGQWVVWWHNAQQYTSIPEFLIINDPFMVLDLV